MSVTQRLRAIVAGSIIVAAVSGCSSGDVASHPLDEELARTSLKHAMQAWADGKTPQDLRPEIVVGDSAWERGDKLDSFEILDQEETTDGSNLHIPVRRKLGSKESTVTYIVGTSPVISIFPQ